MCVCVCVAVVSACEGGQHHHLHWHIGEGRTREREKETQDATPFLPIIDELNFGLHSIQVNKLMTRENQKGKIKEGVR